ncbi:MAG: hypothetical protein RJA90_507, partial [Bacteroidota bacterium]
MSVLLHGIIRNIGWPLLKETADFWASRVERKGPGKYEINNVVAADEWAENVDDNAYTNGMAKEVLGYANQAAKELGLPENPKWKEVQENIAKFKDLRLMYPNIQLQVCSTVNVFNVLYLEHVAAWIDQQDFDFVYWNMMHDA